MKFRLVWLGTAVLSSAFCGCGGKDQTQLADAGNASTSNTAASTSGAPTAPTAPPTTPAAPPAPAQEDASTTNADSSLETSQPEPAANRPSKPSFGAASGAASSPPAGSTGSSRPSFGSASGGPSSPPTEGASAAPARPGFGSASGGPPASSSNQEAPSTPASDGPFPGAGSNAPASPITMSAPQPIEMSLRDRAVEAFRAGNATRAYALFQAHGLHVPNDEIEIVTNNYRWDKKRVVPRYGYNFAVGLVVKKSGNVTDLKPVGTELSALGGSGNAGRGAPSGFGGSSAGSSNIPALPAKELSDAAGKYASMFIDAYRRNHSEGRWSEAFREYELGADPATSSGLGGFLGSFGGGAGGSVGAAPGGGGRPGFGGASGGPPAGYAGGGGGAPPGYGGGQGGPPAGYGGGGGGAPPGYGGGQGGPPAGYGGGQGGPPAGYGGGQGGPPAGYGGGQGGPPAGYGGGQGGPPAGYGGGGGGGAPPGYGGGGGAPSGAPGGAPPAGGGTKSGSGGSGGSTNESVQYIAPQEDAGALNVATGAAGQPPTGRGLLGNTGGPAGPAPVGPSGLNSPAGFGGPGAAAPPSGLPPGGFGAPEGGASTPFAGATPGGFGVVGGNPSDLRLPDGAIPLGPGLTYIGSGEALGELTKKANDMHFDAIVVFEVDVSFIRANGTTKNDCRIRVVNLRADKDSKEKSITSSSLNNTEVAKDKNPDAKIESAVSTFMKRMVESYPMEDLPNITADAVKTKRLAALGNDKVRTKLDLLSEVQLYFSKGLIDETTRLDVFGQIAGGDGRVLAAGTADEKLAVLEKMIRRDTE